MLFLHFLMLARSEGKKAGKRQRKMSYEGFQNWKGWFGGDRSKLRVSFDELRAQSFSGQTLSRSQIHSFSHPSLTNIICCFSPHHSYSFSACLLFIFEKKTDKFFCDWIAQAENFLPLIVIFSVFLEKKPSVKKSGRATTVRF